MKSSAPWSVKGIERDARETAKEAARLKGMTVGEWLNNIIYAAGNPAETDGDIEGLKLTDIITAVEHLNRRLADTDSKVGDSIGEMSRTLGGAVERLQRIERTQPGEASGEIAERIERLEKNGNDRERIDALKALEKAVSQIAVQFSTSQKTATDRIGAVEEKLDGLSERLTSVDSTVGENGVEFLKNAVDGLSVRIARTERIANAVTEADSGEYDAGFVERTSKKLRALGDEVKRSGDQIQSMEGVVTKLAEQIEAAERRSAEGIQKVADTISALHGQIKTDDNRDANRIDIEAAIAASNSDIETRFTELQSAFDKMFSKLDSMGPTNAEFVKSPNVQDIDTQNIEEQTTDIQSSDVLGDHIELDISAPDLGELSSSFDSAGESSTLEDISDADTAESPIDEDVDDVLNEILALAGEDALPAASTPSALVSDDAKPEQDETNAPEPLDLSIDDPSADDSVDLKLDSTLESEAQDASGASIDGGLADEIDASVEDSDQAAAANNADDVEFSFELEDEPENATAPSPDDEGRDILAEVAGILNDIDPDPLAASEASDDNTTTNKEIDDILSELNGIEPAAEETPAPAADELTPEAPSVDPLAELDSVADIEDDAGEAAPQEQPAEQEDYLKQARRKAKEAAARAAQEEKSPSQRKLSAKQRAILAARAKKKRAQLAQSAETAGDKLSLNRPQAGKAEKKSVDTDAFLSDDEQAAASAPQSPFGKVAGVFAAAAASIPFLKGRFGGDDEGEDNNEDASNDAETVGTDGEGKTSLTQRASNARPVTIALAIGIVLTILALFFLVKDFVFGTNETGPNTVAVETSAASPDANPATTLNDNIDGIRSGEELLEVPAAPAVDPAVLYASGVDQLAAANAPAEFDAAVSKLQEAAALGYPPAQLQMGELYKTGQHVDSDLVRARTWFRRAANGGNVLAMHRVGVMNARGDGGPSDAGEAINWFEQAGNRGLVDSMYNLGAIHHPNPSTDSATNSVQDAGKAYFWYSLAAINGDGQAQTLAESVAIALSASQRANLNAEISAWQPIPSEATANAVIAQ